MSKRGRTPASLRNLPQYKDKTTEELDEIIAQMEAGTYDGQIESELDSFAEDYDLSDLKYNDLQLLRRWAELTVRLREEGRIFKEQLEEGDMSPNDRLKEEQRLSGIQRDIIGIQESLSVIRRTRRDTLEDNPMILFGDIRNRAKKFLLERLCYIKCPNCGMLVCTVNFSYPDEDNEIRLSCGRCQNKFRVTSQEAVQMEKENPYK